MYSALVGSLRKRCTDMDKIKWITISIIIIIIIITTLTKTNFSLQTVMQQWNTKRRIPLSATEIEGALALAHVNALRTDFFVHIAHRNTTSSQTTLTYNLELCTGLWVRKGWHSSACALKEASGYMTYHDRQSQSYVPSTAVAYPGILFGGGRGVFTKFSWGQRAEKPGIWGREPPSQGFRSICKWVKPVLLLGCYGCFFNGTGNSA
jgi:hypothetical protein